MVRLFSAYNLYTAILLYPALSLADCECGYLITQTGVQYTHSLIDDFSKYPDTVGMTALTKVLSDWDVQEYGFEGNETEGTYGRQNSPDNVWIKDGKLHLRQRAHPKGDKGPVSVAELHSKRKDFFHGSFRALYKVQEGKDAEGGAVAGFFFYYDDTAETDIEILTTDNETTIHYTQHPSYIASSDTIIPGASFKKSLDKPWTQYQEHRFDWGPELTTFYQNNIPNEQMAKNVPQHDGKLMLNIWSNGGTWSGKPSTKDVEMTVKQIHAYFNTTASQTGSDAVFNAACKKAGGPKRRRRVCKIDDKVGITSGSVSFASARSYVAFLGAIIGSMAFTLF